MQNEARTFFLLFVSVYVSKVSYVVNKNPRYIRSRLKSDSLCYKREAAHQSQKPIFQRIMIAGFPETKAPQYLFDNLIVLNKADNSLDNWV